MLMRALLTVVAASAVLSSAGCGGRNAESFPRSPGARRGDLVLAPDSRTIDGRVPDRATLDSLLKDNDLRADLVPVIVSVARTVFDPRRLKANHAFHLECTIDGLLRTFEYEIDLDNFLRVTAASDSQPTDMKAELVPYQKERRLTSVRGGIDHESPSLFAAMEAAGEHADLSMELADIFGGEIDFNSDLQPGDGFSLAVEKIFRDGQFVAYGPVVAAEFQNEGRVLKAFRYTVPGGKPGYYDQDGRSLKRFFLKSPLKFEPRVTSGFSRARFHPILRIYRPHLGVDYQAPLGAPVVAVANGTVVAAGWAGEGGRLIHLRHASGFETLYMHLSAIAPGVRPGAHVSQGQTIGRVGSTGMSTGPHLDYRVKKNGAFQNPLLVHRSLPPGEPIPAGAMAEFAAQRDKSLAQLAAPVPAAPAVVAPVAAAPAARPAPVHH
jgi:murein DD-endopeptidase MepM/ murein hydrolase activator NlpD